MKETCTECLIELRNIGILPESFNSVDYTYVFVCGERECRRYGLLTTISTPSQKEER